ncbi:MAG: RSP_7527 family protein [Pseudomonadota bacterium]
MVYPHLNQPELARIEAEARRMRSQAMRDGVAALTARIRALFAHEAPAKAGRTA